MTKTITPFPHPTLTGHKPDIIPIDINAAMKGSTTDALRVRGGHELNGDIVISGAKNAALKLMCAALLTDEPVTLTNMPVTLSDVQTQGAVLKHIGADVTLRRDKTVTLHAATITNPDAPYDLVRKMRASIVVLGPLLARHGLADVSLPGGCAIGTRPVDFHIDGLRAFGAEITIEDGYIKARAPGGRLPGGEYTFPKPSHTACENLLMAATLARGTCTIYNAPLEPEIEDLGKLLIAMGAKIEGLGTKTITIHGVEKLHGTTYACMPDRIETGTWLIASAMCGGTLRLHNTRIDFLPNLVPMLKKAGMHIEITVAPAQAGAHSPMDPRLRGDDTQTITAHRNGLKLQGLDIMTEPFPGFPTDLQAQVMALLTTCEGAGMVTETVFENRFMHVPELVRMGANITVHGSSAIIRGVPKLKGAEVMATDLRASVALLLAGLAATGETTINRIYHLDRGYEDIVGKLSAVGADIARVKGDAE
jgi:UDP-N-acetylglucosamine 1-carboxyvinyltransferase